MESNTNDYKECLQMSKSKSILYAVKSQNIKILCFSRKYYTIAYFIEHLSIFLGKFYNF
jgi:hypothetical protein